MLADTSNNDQLTEGGLRRPASLPPWVGTYVCTLPQGWDESNVWRDFFFWMTAHQSAQEFAGQQGFLTPSLRSVVLPHLRPALRAGPRLGLETQSLDRGA